MDRSRSPQPERDSHRRSRRKDDYNELDESGRYRERNKRRRRSHSQSKSPRPNYRNGERDGMWRASRSPRRSRSPRDRRNRRHDYYKEGEGNNDDDRYHRSRRRHRRRRSRSEESERGDSSMKDGQRSCDRHQKAERSAALALERRSRMPLPSQQSAFKGQDLTSDKEALVEKRKPNFGASGKLAAETNTVAGTNIVLKYNEPPDARKPPVSQQWCLYVFKGKETLDTLELYTRSCWLFGRERAVADYPIEHPSCSKQHAVVQFRHLEKTNEYGDKIGGVKPYLIDLESANGTKVNGDIISDRRYIELKSGDVITFGESLRDYVLMLPR